MNIPIKQEAGFQYIDEGEGETLILLHGLFGALSNWEHVVAHFMSYYRIVIPLMPLYEMPIKQANLEGLEKFIASFIDFKQFELFTLVGNSLGGHLALIYTLNNSRKVSRLVLTGSSGLYEDTMGGSFIKRGNYDYIAERVQYTFYDPQVATQEYIDEVFNILQNRSKAIRIVAIAKSAQRHNLAHELARIQAKTLLIWGLNDTITPPLVGHEFRARITQSRLRFIDQCCHAPMMEHPTKFNAILEQFLKDTQ